VGNRVCVWVRAVVNHGVDEELVERVFAQNRAFFDLPAEQKRLILADCNNRRARLARPAGLVPVPRVENRGASIWQFDNIRYIRSRAPL